METNKSDGEANKLVVKHTLPTFGSVAPKHNPCAPKKQTPKFLHCHAVEKVQLEQSLPDYVWQREKKRKHNQKKILLLGRVAMTKRTVGT